jgi:hypothetical protein
MKAKSRKQNQEGEKEKKYERISIQLEGTALRYLQGIAEAHKSSLAAACRAAIADAEKKQWWTAPPLYSLTEETVKQIVEDHGIKLTEDGRDELYFEIQQGSIDAAIWDAVAEEAERIRDEGTDAAGEEGEEEKED